MKANSVFREDGYGAEEPRISDNTTTSNPCLFPLQALTHGGSISDLPMF